MIFCLGEKLTFYKDRAALAFYGIGYPFFWRIVSLIRF